MTDVSGLMKLGNAMFECVGYFEMLRRQMGSGGKCKYMWTNKGHADLRCT